MPITLSPGFWVHYSAVGAGSGLAAAGSSATATGGYLSITAIPTGIDLSSLFYAYRRFARAGDYADRGYFRCLFAVNNTGVDVDATLSPVLTGELGGLFDGPLWGMGFIWDSIAASAFDSASPQADTWQLAPFTAAQVLADDHPDWVFGSTVTIPQGFCRGFWITHRTSSGFSPHANVTKAVGATISLTTVPA